MTKKIKLTDLPQFDMVDHLDSEQAVADYLAIVREENDPVELTHALENVARARGKTGGLPTPA